MQALAKRLQYLNRHPAEYLSYFWWKDHYRVRTDAWQKALCELCAQLNDEDLARKRTSYADLTHWWREGSHCLRKENIDWRTNISGIRDAVRNRSHL